MRSIEAPPDVLDFKARWREWLKQRLSTAARPRVERQVYLALAHDGTSAVTSKVTEYRVRHNLPHAPTGWKVIDQDAAAHVYSIRKPDRFFVYLKSDTAGVTVTVEIA